MRQTLLTCLTLAALAAPTSPAHGQALPERIRAVVGERVEMARTVRYQQGREEQTDRQTKTVKIGAEGELSLVEHLGRHHRHARQRQRRDD